MTYQQRIADIAPYADPRHIEAFMRCECGTLDGLSDETFRNEALIGRQCAQRDPFLAEKLARSYGL